MNQHTDFNGTASAAKQTIADDAFDRSMALIATTENTSPAGRAAFKARVLPMSGADEAIELEARMDAFEKIAYDRDYPDRLADCQEQAANERATMAGWSDRNDRDGIDHHAAKNPHDSAGLRIL